MAHQADIDNQSETAHILCSEVQVVVVHRDDINDSISMNASGDVISLGWQCQIAACNAPPHVDRQVIAHLITECICSGGIDIGYASERKIFVHTRHIGQCCPFRQELEQSIERCGF